MITRFLGQIQNLTVTSPPAEEPVSLATAKLHLRVDYTDDDALISALISAARERCEALTHRSFVTRSYLLQLDGFPFSHAIGATQVLCSERFPNMAYGLIKVPKPPLLTIDAINYLDNNGTSQLLDPSQYLVGAGGKLQGVVTPAFGLTWPSTRYQLNSVSIAYTAGYGDATAQPPSLVPAMLLLIGGWYQNRESISDLGLAPIPMGVNALLASLKWGSYA